METTLRCSQQTQSIKCDLCLGLGGFGSGDTALAVAKGIAVSGGVVLKG